MQHRRIAATAALLGDPSRAAMVLALMDGRSRTAKKLALDAGVTPQTATAHLKKLVTAKLLCCEARGRVEGISAARGRCRSGRRGAVGNRRRSDPIRSCVSCASRAAAMTTSRDSSASLSPSVCCRPEIGSLPSSVLSRHAAGGSAPALPLLHRLDRAPAAYRRHAGRCAAAPLSRKRMASSHGEFEEARSHRARQGGIHACLRY